MKKLFILLIMHLVSLGSSAQNATEAPPIVISIEDTVFSKYVQPDHSEIPVFLVKRSNISQTVMLILPANSTGNSVDLYQNKDYHHAIRRDTKFMAGFDAKLTLNLTLLEDGNYSAFYSSCYFNGTMKIHLITE